MKNAYAILAIAWMFLVGPLVFIELYKVPYLEKMLVVLDEWTTGILFVLLYFGGLGLLVWLAEKN